jgi:predicted nucleotide-binding protein
MPRGPSRPYPAIPVKEAAQVAQAIRDHNAGRPMNRILLADAMSRGPNAVLFRDLVTASAKYGFTKGSYAAESIELSDLGEQLTKPRSQEEHLDALRVGMRNIPLFNQILTFYNNNKLPPPEFLRNALERDPFAVQPEWSQEAAEIFTLNGREVGFVRNISGSLYVILESGPPTDDAETQAVVTPIPEPKVAGPFRAADVDIAVETAPAGSSAHNGSAAFEPAPEVISPRTPTTPSPQDDSTPPENKQFFIAHGWDKEALSQVQAILNRLRIPYVVAQDEANAGRPISQKIRDMMKSCYAGIFIFSADEEFKDKDGKTIWRARENVVYELGAASLEYGQRIVIFKEKGVYFPSDFRDLGYIEYEKGSLDAKAMDLLMELIALGAARITAGA